MLFGSKGEGFLALVGKQPFGSQLFPPVLKHFKQGAFAGNFHAVDDDLIF